MTPEEVTALTQSLQDNAERLGFTWQMRTATVTAGGASPTLTFDGDDTPAVGETISSMIGLLSTDERVYVIGVPPAGQYVVGRMNGVPMTGQLVGWTAAMGVGSFVTAETAVLATGSIIFQAGCAYEIDFETDVEGSANGNFANLQIRRTSGAGTVIRANSGHPMSSLLGFGSTCKGSAIVVNNTSSDITDVAVLTLSSPMTGQVRITGSTNRLAFLRARYIGSAAVFINATAL